MLKGVCNSLYILKAYSVGNKTSLFGFDMFFVVKYENLDFINSHTNSGCPIEAYIY